MVILVAIGVSHAAAQSDPAPIDAPSTVPRGHTPAPEDFESRDNWFPDHQEPPLLQTARARSAFWLEYGLGYGRTQIGAGEGNANLNLSTNDRDGFSSFLAAGGSIGLREDQETLRYLDFGIHLQGSQEAFPLHWADHEPDFGEPEIGSITGLVALRDNGLFYGIAYDHHVYSGSASATSGGSTLLRNGAPLAPGESFRFGYHSDAIRFTIGQSLDGPATPTGTPRLLESPFNWRVEIGFGTMDLLAIQETVVNDVFDVERDEELTGLILGTRGGLQNVFFEDMSGTTLGGYGSLAVSGLLDHEISVMTASVELGLVYRHSPVVARIYAGANGTWTEPYGSDRFAVRPLGGDVLNFQAGISVGFEF